MTQFRSRDEQYNDPRFDREITHEVHKGTGCKVTVYTERRPTGLNEGSTYDSFSGHWSTPDWSYPITRYVSIEELERYAKEAEARGAAEERGKCEGYLFHNPGTGTEYLPYHPVASGECPDAENIRQATGAELLSELQSAWASWAEDRSEKETVSTNVAALEARVKELEDVSENLIIAIGMGWDLEGVVANARAALKREGGV